MTNLEKKLGGLFEKSILIIVGLLVVAWAFTGTVLFMDYLHERESFLTVLVDSHHDELISGNWREFLEAAKRNRYQYFSEIRVCWANSKPCPSDGANRTTLYLTKTIVLGVPRQAASPIVRVEGNAILMQPILNVTLLSLLFLIVICITFYLNFLTKRKVASVTDSIRNLANLITDDLKFVSEFPEELLPIAATILSAMDRLKLANDESVKNGALIGLASQVSHDIRSPLAALEMLSANILELPEEKRIILRNSIN